MGVPAPQFEIYVPQLDGCSYVSGGLNCTCATEAMAEYLWTRGQRLQSACDIRRATHDKVAGTNLEQMQSVAAAHGIKTTLYRPATTSLIIGLARTGRYGIHWQGAYQPLVGTSHDSFRGQFRGNHDWYIDGGDATYARVGDPGADGRRAGIPSGYQNIPWDLMIECAQLLDLGNGQTMAERFGSRHVYALAGPPLAAQTGAKFIATMHGTPGHPSTYTNLYDTPNGTKTGSVSKASYLVQQSKVDGLWWYRILTNANGSPASASARGHYFKPNSHTEFDPA